MAPAKAEERPTPYFVGRFLCVRHFDNAWILISPEHIESIGPACGEETRNRIGSLINFTRGHIFVDHTVTQVAAAFGTMRPERKAVGVE